MIGLLCLFLALVAAPFKSKIRLEAENTALRHQLNVLRRPVRGRVRLTDSDRWLLIQLYRFFPSTLKVVTIIRPETLVRWPAFAVTGDWESRSCVRSGPQDASGAFEIPWDWRVQRRN
jgi:hypothetical protein